MDGERGERLDFSSSSCISYDRTSVGRRRSLVPVQGSNYFEKICLSGVEYGRICGNERLWSFERVLDSFLEGFDNKTIRSVETRAECLKFCLMETEFQCRSCEYNIQEKVCTLSPEDRRTKPNNFVTRPGSLIDYLENQCVKMLPDCRYAIQNDVMVVSMDQLEFANVQSDCESLCDKSRIMTCRSYTYDPEQKRCYLSGDDSISLNTTVLPFKQGVITGEKQCTVSQCQIDQGTIIYEKITGRSVRTARRNCTDSMNHRGDLQRSAPGDATRTRVSVQPLQWTTPGIDASSWTETHRDDPQTYSVHPARATSKRSASGVS
ncbi:hypothetical protein Pcinc_039409 [Petrolisthes cinctipes]|uniref:Apple domain-containing protein n=1 Tax=Petrolisthes cinctipes TaxID=88211 RepID=A0AAE1EJ72_PETCI|nr:hypothetical protein Pcinc_039409 [Petrolisthes cinctipes]